MSVASSHRLMFVGLLILGALTRLPALEHPRQVVFDEVHFGKFISAYCCTHEYFFDIHPPHAKVLIAAAAALTDYDGSFSFETIGQPYPTDVSVTAFRLLPAVAGALLPALLFLLARQLGASPGISFLAGWLVVFDNALTVHSRLISLDSLLLAATLGSLICYLAAATHPRTQWWWYAAAGMLAGLAAGIKFTGLAALAILGVLLAVELLQHSPGRRANVRSLLLRGAAMVTVAAAVYLAGWALHFILLTNPGPGNAFHQPDFSNVLLVDFVRETLDLHHTMLTVNYGLEATHPYASRWYTWLIMQRPIFYWQGEAASVYFLGNPLLWWGSTVLLLAALFSGIINFGQAVASQRQIAIRHRQWIPLTGYAIALLPLIRVPRALFLYHYLTPLLFALLAGLMWLERDACRTTSRCRPLIVMGVLVSFSLFVFFSPLTYGFTVPAAWQDSLFWFATWR